MKTGVIGLGAMGHGMAMNFHKNGYLHAVWNRTTAKAEQLARQTGALLADSPTHLATECELIIVCVSRDADVLEMVNAVAEGIRSDSVVVDTSTVSSETAKQAAHILAKKDAHFLDCPVSGGSEGAKNGTLSVMAGGSEFVLDHVRATLDAIASRIVYIGPTGSGQACKAVNQIVCAGLYEAVAEGLSFGTKMGLDMDRVIDAISAGAASNWVLHNRSNNMLTGHYPPGFKVNLHLKDLNICQQMARNAGIEHLPVTEITMHDYEKLIEMGYGEEDTSAVYRLK